jgi:DNA-binding NtrC family response regulator
MSSDTTIPLHLLMAAGSAQDCDRVLAELQKGGYAVVHQCVHSINSLRDALQNDSWDVILSNHCKSELQTDKVLALAKDLAPEVPLIILSDDTDVNLAVSLMKSGAADYISVNGITRGGHDPSEKTG